MISSAIDPGIFESRFRTSSKLGIGSSPSSLFSLSMYSTANRGPFGSPSAFTTLTTTCSCSFGPAVEGGGALRFRTRHRLEQPCLNCIRKVLLLPEEINSHGIDYGRAFEA